MKRQLDRLKGKRLVTGDPNLMTKDEICINATPNGVEVKEIGIDGKIKDLAGGSTSGLNLRYFATQENTVLGELLAMAFLLKIKYTNQNGIGSIIPPILGLAEYSSVSLDSALEAMCLNTVAIALDLEKKMYVNGTWTSISDMLGGDFSYLLPLEITEEEFYDTTNLHSSI